MPTEVNFFRLLLDQTKLSRKWSLVYFLSLFLWSCGNLSQSGINHFNLTMGSDITNIHDVKLKQDNKSTVYLQGYVVESVPLLKQKVYQLQDSTGTIWVLTQNPVQQGQRILVKGHLRYQSIILAGKDVGEVYIQEQVRGQGE